MEPNKRFESGIGTQRDETLTHKGIVRESKGPEMIYKDRGASCKGVALELRTGVGGSPNATIKVKCQDVNRKSETPSKMRNVQRSRDECMYLKSRSL
jgi:hypothetical protein